MPALALAGDETSASLRRERIEISTVSTRCISDQPNEYKGLVNEDLELSKQEISAGFVMLTHGTAWQEEKDEADLR
ncbi:hypothetical protein HBI39_114520 [Parastagonospora nodorum]|nr:hypothetical protein HBI39_114520 [Parastagonospora nodorum]